ncbi:MAG: 4-(cytidine 5'-diphospho)-2-C-methyl-D-erythritol kinase, partial [Defluviitaleaceae bacterium]|nr:4-(cytidine 5'-diphospho)-2-C-methyl-D-erythritol kinase [Defluviitaleaceae bacterium]
MEIINIKARAKINLYLDVLGRRDDGYHDVSGIMQSIALFDEITIKKVYKPDYLKLVNNLSWLPNDERNLAYQAAKYLIENFGGEQGINAGIFIELNKTIPASAGLGGGSADCAAVLVGVR